MNTESVGGLEWILPVVASEQRQSPRFDHDMYLIARLANRGRAIAGRVIDMSFGGMKAELVAELEPEQALELEFGLRDTSAVVHLIAAIRWRKDRLYGLEFLYRSDSERARMKQAFAALFCCGE